MSSPAVRGEPALDDLLIVGVDTALWEVTSRELKTLTPLALGGQRETFLFGGAGYPLVAEKFEVSLEWEHLGTKRGPVERRLKVPGPHTLILWRYEYLTYAGNGSRREFFLPWHPAGDVWTATLPDGLTDEKIAPIVRLSGPDETDAALTYEAKSPVDYAAGDPATGEVWFSVGEKKFKLAVADIPAAGDIVYVDIVPVFSVCSDGASEKQFRNPSREPRKLRLVEK